MEAIQENSGLSEFKTYSTQEVAEWIGVTKKTLYKYMKEGKISFFQVDAVIRFEKEDVQDFLSKNKRNAE